MPLVSVIIRTKNEGATLDAVLESVKGQRLPPTEVIIVDSGSSDDTLAIATAHHTAVYHIQPELFTYGSALNLGLTKAVGEIGISLAGHALPANRFWLEELVRPFHDSRIAGAVSRMRPYTWGQRSWALASLDILYRWFALRSQAVTCRLFTNACSAVRMSTWRQLAFHEQLPSCEDQLWSRQIIRMGYRIAYCPASVVYHGHNLSLSQKLAGIRRDYAAMRQVNGILKQEQA